MAYTADVSDSAGNAATQHSGSFTYDASASIESSAFDFGAALNATEDDGDATLTVATADVDDGSTVTLTLNGQTYTGAVSSGSASIVVATADLQALTQGAVAYTVDVSDSAGNAAAQHSGSFTYDASASIASSAFDFGAVLNASEDDGDATLTVATADVDDGSTCLLYTSPSPRD